MAAAHDPSMMTLAHVACVDGGDLEAGNAADDHLAFHPGPSPCPSPHRHHHGTMKKVLQHGDEGDDQACHGAFSWVRRACGGHPYPCDEGVKGGDNLDYAWVPWVQGVHVVPQGFAPQRGQGHRLSFPQMRGHCETFPTVPVQAFPGIPGAFRCQWDKAYVDRLAANSRGRKRHWRLKFGVHI